MLKLHLPHRSNTLLKRMRSAPTTSPHAAAL
jgi:hypothetical protein